MAVIGGGDFAYEQARILSETSKSVAIVQEHGAPRSWLFELAARADVKVITESRNLEVKLSDENRVESLAYERCGESHILNVKGIFVAPDIVAPEQFETMKLASDEGVVNLFPAGTLRANIDETVTEAIITEQGGQEKNHRERSQDGSSFRSQRA